MRTTTLCGAATMMTTSSGAISTMTTSCGETSTTITSCGVTATTTTSSGAIAHCLARSSRLQVTKDKSCPPRNLRREGDVNGDAYPNQHALEDACDDGDGQDDGDS